MNINKVTLHLALLCGVQIAVYDFSVLFKYMPLIADGHYFGTLLGEYSVCRYLGGMMWESKEATE